LILTAINMKTTCNPLTRLLALSQNQSGTDPSGGQPLQLVVEQAEGRGSRRGADHFSAKGIRGIISAALITVGVLAASPPMGADLSDGLVAHYPLDANALDRTANHLDGIVNGATPTSDRFGAADRACAFDGMDDEITIPGTENLNFSSGGFTLCAWIALTGPNADKCVVGKHACGTPNGYFLGVTANKPVFLVGSTDYSKERIYGPPLQADAAWHFVVGVYDGQIQYLYVDGQLVAAQALNYDYTTSTLLKIGNLSPGTTSCAGSYGMYFGGKVDDVRIYNRALSASEIAELLIERGDTTPPALDGRIAFARYDNDAADTRTLWWFDTVTRQSQRVPLPGTVPRAHNARWTPDGEWIVFSGGQDFNTQIYTVRPDGTGSRRITNGNGDLTDPAVSPVDMRVAYNQVYGDVFGINFDGTGLADLGYGIGMVNWSPDGAKLVGTDWALSGGYNSDLWVWNLTTGAKTKITSRPAGTAYVKPAWSPDGSKIAAAFVLQNGTVDIVLMNADGSGIVNLTADWASKTCRPGALMGSTSFSSQTTMAATSHMISGSCVRMVLAGRNSFQEAVPRWFRRRWLNHRVQPTRRRPRSTVPRTSSRRPIRASVWRWSLTL
jgi:hypothetical protein